MLTNFAKVTILPARESAAGSWHSESNSFQWGKWTDAFERKQGDQLSSFVLFSLLVLEAPIPVCSIEIIAIVENFC